ncbi:hypothetical protein B0H10DRAFT_1954650 [Mycena sp. CBHHK59/15]|nr:hypothetical protein B0H10DRAFT_1954650 [Mycena sp. CBHHK59/15]
MPKCPAPEAGGADDRISEAELESNDGWGDTLPIPDSDDEQNKLDDNNVFGTLGEPEDFSENIGPNNANWWPWTNQEDALLNIMTGFPRLIFSESELDVTRWFATKCGVQRLPPIRQVKRHRSKILSLCSANLKSVDGCPSNTFTVLDLGKILVYESSNHLIRPFIRVLSEDSGELLRESCRAEKWHNNVLPNLSWPMVCRDEQDFFLLMNPRWLTLAQKKELSGRLFFLHDGVCVMAPSGPRFNDFGPTQIRKRTVSSSTVDQMNVKIFASFPELDSMTAFTSIII